MLEENISLCRRRIEKAHECLKSAIVLLKAEDYTSSVNRAYYAIFHSVRAIMVLDGEERKKHSGVVSYFQENYVKTGVFDKIYSYMIKNAFQIRQESDYEDFCIVTAEDADEQIKNAEEFIFAVEKYVNSIIS